MSDCHGGCAHDSPSGLVLRCRIATPLCAWPSTTWFDGALCVNMQRTNAFPLAGLGSSAICAPCFGADVPQATACSFVVTIGLHVCGELMAEAVSRDRVLVLGPQGARQAAYLHGQIDGAADLRKDLWLGLSIQEIIDNDNKRVRICCVIGDRPNWLTLCSFDFCACDAEMDQ